MRDSTTTVPPRQLRRHANLQHRSRGQSLARVDAQAQRQSLQAARTRLLLPLRRPAVVDDKPEVVNKRSRTEGPVEVSGPRGPAGRSHPATSRLFVDLAPIFRARPPFLSECAHPVFVI